MAEGFECSFLELDTIGDALELDLRPFPFQFPVHGEVAEDRIRLIQAAERTLTAKGLIDGSRFVDDVPDLLGVFARGRLAVAALGTVDGESCCARAVTDSRTAVLAVQRDQSIRFDPVTPLSMVRAVLRLLGPTRPGPGRSVTVTVDPLAPQRKPAEDEDLGGRRYLQPVRGPQDSADIQRGVIDGIMRRPRTGSGYFAVTVRGP